jgi:non-specific serine/threonine protein kinase
MQKRGDPATARALCTQSLALMRELGDRRGVASALFVLGRLSAFEADYDAARTTVEQALALYRELGLRAMAASASVTLASVVLRQGEAEQARALLEQGLTEARDLGDEQMSAAALTDLGHLAVRAGDHHRAEALLRDALDLLRELRLSGGTIDCLQRLIELAAASRRFEPAAQLLGAVEAMRTAAGTPIAAAVRSDCDETAAILCAALGNEEFTAALSAGRALTLEQCMSLAAELLPDGALTPTST